MEGQSLESLVGVQSTCQDGLDSFQRLDISEGSLWTISGNIKLTFHFKVHYMTDFIVHFYIEFVAINEVVKASESTQEFKISLVHFQRSRQESRLQKCTASNVHVER